MRKAGDTLDYRKASAKQLIDALNKQERHPDLKLIEALLQRGEEMVPALTEIVEVQCYLVVLGRPGESTSR